MFEVVSTFVVIDTIKGKINTIAIDNPIKFVVPNLFFKFLMFLVFKLVINYSANLRKHINTKQVYTKILTKTFVFNI